MKPERRNFIASKIAFNIKAEAEANEFYFELLEIIPDVDKHIIEGIIKDEMNHAIILGRLLERYTKILPSEFEPLISLKIEENK